MKWLDNSIQLVDSVHREISAMPAEVRRKGWARIAVILIIVVCVAALTGCSKGEKPTKASATDYSVEIAELSKDHAKFKDEIVKCDQASNVRIRIGDYSGNDRCSALVLAFHSSREHKGYKGGWPPVMRREDRNEHTSVTYSVACSTRGRFFAGSAFAQAAPNTAILDGIADSYEAAAAGWMAPMLAYANRLFGLLLAIELGVTATKYALEKDDARNLIAAMVGKILGVGFFYALLQFAPTWIPALMNSFRDAGAAVGGVSVLSPSAVFALGLNFVIIIFKSISDMDMWDAIGVIVMTTPAAVLIIIAFVVVAGQLLVTIIESYFVIGGASIFLGFGGSRWTQDFVQKYLGYAISVGVRLMTIYLLIGASNTLFTGWADLLRSSTSGLQFIINAWVVMGGAAFFAFLAWMIPSVASSMLSGSPSLTSGAAAGVIGGMAAGAIAGAATAGKSLATIASATADRSPGRPGAAAGLPAAVSTLSGTAPTRTNSASPQQMAPPLRSSAPATPLASGKGSDTHSSTNGNPGTHPVPVANSLAPPSSSSNASASSSSFDASAAEANGIGGANSSGALHDASGGKDKGPSLLDRLRNVSPPQLPSDAAPGGTVHIRLDAGKD